MYANLVQETYKIQGMSCTGCEGVIEQKLQTLRGIKEVRSSFSNRSLSVTYDPSQINYRYIKRTLKKAGFEMERAVPNGSAGNSGTVRPDGTVGTAGKAGTAGGVRTPVKKEKSFSTLQFLGVVVILLGVYLFIDKTVGFNNIPQVTSSMGYGVLFVIGLLTSLHCVAMCGGISMSQCIPKGTESAGAKAKVLPSLLYNLGRVISYTIIGGIAGALGSAVSFSGQARGVVAIIAGLFMVVMGISMLGIFPWMNKITPRLPRIFRVKAGAAGKGKGPFIVGLLNGLMPCGPLQAMQIYALGTGSFIAGAMSMFFFSLGTVPLLFGLGAIVTFIGSKFTKKMIKVSAILVVVLGIIMFGRGFVLSGMSFPTVASVFHLSHTSGNVSAAGTTAATKDGVQNITTTLSRNAYPNFTVQKGIPVVWDLKADASSLTGCNQTLVLTAYNIQVTLKEGDNIIKFTPKETGTITYSCWMGMVTGQIQVVEADSPAAATATTAQAADTTAASGSIDVNQVQNVSSTFSGGLYPNIIVQKGVPVVWNIKVDPGVLTGCNKMMILDAYNMQVNLQEGDNYIRFTPSESGTLTYSCWMGMVTGQIQIVDSASGISGTVGPEDPNAQKSPAQTDVAPPLGNSCCS